MTSDGKIVQVLLVGQEAEAYLAFKHHQKKFFELLAGGVFELQSGQAEINVNNGQVQSIHIHRMTYKRGLDVVQ